MIPSFLSLASVAIRPFRFARKFSYKRHRRKRRSFSPRRSSYPSLASVAIRAFRFARKFSYRRQRRKRRDFFPNDPFVPFVGFCSNQGLSVRPGILLQKATEETKGLLPE